MANAVKILRDKIGSWGYLDEEGFKRVTAANAGILSQPHSIVRIPLVRVADPAPEFQGEDHSRPQVAPGVDLLLAALRVAAQSSSTAAREGFADCIPPAAAFRRDSMMATAVRDQCTS